MKPRIGYVSSFDDWEGFGFLRPADSPRSLVKFHRSALGDTAVDHVLVGLEVLFEIDPTQEQTEEWPVARSVTVSHEPDDDDTAIAEIDRL